MKRTLIFFTLVFATAAAHADFVIKQKVESATQHGDMTMQIKANKVRVDMAPGPMGEMSSIVDLKTGDVTTLMHQQKMAMKVSASQMKQMMEQMKSRMNNGSTNTEPPKLQDTGKTETVGKYSTEIYTWTNTDLGSGGTVWVAKNFPDYVKIQKELERLDDSPMYEASKGMIPDMSKLPGMVIKTKASVHGQKVTTTLISAEEKPVDSSVFDVPKDYHEMSPPTMPDSPAAKSAPDK
jgi:Domain of unknown function (DUF4412)